MFKRFYEKENIIMGFSNSSTCEIGLSDTTKVPWQSVLYLLDECSTSSLNKNESLDSSFSDSVCGYSALYISGNHNKNKCLDDDCSNSSSNDSPSDSSDSSSSDSGF